MADQPWWEQGAAWQPAQPATSAAPAAPAVPPVPPAPVRAPAAQTAPPGLPPLPLVPGYPPPAYGPPAGVGNPAPRGVWHQQPFAPPPSGFGPPPGHGPVRPPVPLNPWAKALVRRKPPPEMRTVIAFLVANLAMSFVLTFAYFTKSGEIADHLLRHYGFTDVRIRDAERTAYRNAATYRLIGNLVSSAILVYVVNLFLRGSMLAYWRTMVVSAIGLGSDAILLVYPYPHWFHVIVVVQACVLGLLLLSINHPAVRAYCRGIDYS